MDGTESFYRNWAEYKSVFGYLQREHWLGNQNIYLLTAQAFLKGSEVRFDIVFKRESRMRYAKYSSFKVDNEAAGYKLHVSGYSGDAGDYFNYNNGYKFSTYDKDNDASSTECAKDKGAWWYGNCSHVNLNSHYDRLEQLQGEKRFVWYSSNRLIFSEMKIRRK